MVINISGNKREEGQVAKVHIGISYFPALTAPVSAP